MSLLSVRRGCGSIGCMLQSSCMLGFGMSRSPLQAILAYSLHNLFQCVTVRFIFVATIFRAHLATSLVSIFRWSQSTNDWLL